VTRVELVLPAWGIDQARIEGDPECFAPVLGLQSVSRVEKRNPGSDCPDLLDDQGPRYLGVLDHVLLRIGGRGRHLLGGEAAINDHVVPGHE
jgi:hypothetical protein